MELQQDILLTPLINKRLLWASIAALLGTTAALGYWAVRVQAFEAFYDYSRDHESWQLDHVVMVGLIFTSLAGAMGAFFAGLFARRLLGATQVQLKAERKLRLLQQQAAVGTMLGGMAHHINNHLQPVILLTRMVQDNLSPQSEDQKDLSVALEAAQNASAVLQRIQKISLVNRQTNGHCTVAPEIHAIVAATRTKFAANVTLTADIAPVLGDVALDTSELETVLRNLLHNARDSLGHRPGTVAVRLTEDPALTASANEAAAAQRICCICISDTGEGINEDQIQRSFDPFYTTKPPGQGMGLGLAEAKALVERAGGQIELRSTRGVGTEVTVYLPLE